MTNILISASLLVDSIWLHHDVWQFLHHSVIVLVLKGIFNSSVGLSETGVAHIAYKKLSTNIRNKNNISALPPNLYFICKLLSLPIVINKIKINLNSKKVTFSLQIFFSLNWGKKQFIANVRRFIARIILRMMVHKTISEKLLV